MSWIITGKEADPLLLDSYSGATAAYSLRQLSWAYGGPVVRVRRDNDNAEQNFTATEVSDGTLAAWVAAGNDGFVRTWYDQSGNGNDATQVASGDQPKIVDASGGLVSENGKAALSFNGTDAFLGNLTASISSSSVLAVSVSKTNSATLNQLIFSFQNSCAAHQQYATPGNTGRTYCYAHVFGYYGSTDVTQRLLVSVFDGSLTGDSQRLKMYADGAQRSLTFSGTVPSSVSGTGLQIGRPFATDSSYFLGNIQEIIVYPSNQSANRAAIEANINAYYNIF